MPAELSLRGERVWLRPMEIDDAVALARSSHREEETNLTGPRVPASVMAFRRWIEDLDDAAHVFAICRTGEDACIGIISVRRIDMDNGTAETGIGLFRGEDRGKGLGSEAKRLLLEYAFDVLGLHAISCTIAAVNTRSARAVERQGYRYAGRLTAFETTTGGRICDQLVYDMTREDWEAHRNG